MSVPPKAEPEVDVTVDPANPPAENTDDTPPGDDEDPDADPDADTTQKENRYQRLVNKIKENDKASAEKDRKHAEEMEEMRTQMAAMQSKFEKAPPSAEAQEIAEEMEEWFKEAWGDDAVSKKTFKEMRGFIQRMSRQSITDYISEVNKKQSEHQEEIELTKGQFTKEYNSLVDDGMDRFPLEQLLGHAKTMMEKRAKRLGVDFEEIPVPDLELVYVDLERLKPKPVKQAPNPALDKSNDGSGGTKKVWSLDDLRKRRW